MNKYSTLTYLIKNFQPEQVKLEEVRLDAELDEFLIEMDAEVLSPSDRSVKNILDFACSYETVQTENAGIIEMNLN